jgi:hypothetical protein
MQPICCPETSVSNYHHSLRNSSEERSSQILLQYFFEQIIVQKAEKIFTCVGL